MDARTSETHASLRDRFPRPPRIGGALLPGGRSRLTTELFAGVTLAALVLPLNIGYAEAAGLPVIVGINAALLPAIAFVLLSGSRNLVAGPDASVAALLAGVIPTVSTETGVAPEELGLGVAMLTGLVLVGFWLLNAGTIVRWISKSVLVGFLAGLGIEILTSQVEKMLGVSVDTGEWFTDVVEIVRSVPDGSAASVAVGASTVVLLRLGKRYAPRLPGPLIVLVLVSGVVHVFEPGGVSVLGDIPSGLPELSFPVLALETWIELFGVAMAISVLTMAEGLLMASSAARRHGDELDPNGEMAAIGVANVAAAVSTGMPVGASASRTAAMESAGSRCQTAGLVSALIILAVALWFTDLVAVIPSAALAGLVANAVVSVIDVDAMRGFARVRRSELFIALGCAFGVLVFGVVGGLVLAMAATMLDVIRRVSAAPWFTLAPPSGDWEMQRFAAAAEPDATPEDPDGVTFVRLAGPLFFVNADTLRERLAQVAESDTAWVVLDFESVTDIDPTASEALAESLVLLHRHDKVLGVARASAPVRDLLDRYGLTDAIGPEHLYVSNRAALAAYLIDGVDGVAGPPS